MMQPNEPVREQLLGYLLEALEPDERHRLEAELLQDPTLQRDLEELNDSLEPLRLTEDPPEPPTGLAERTCQMIAAFQADAHATRLPSLAPAGPRGF